MAVTVRYRFVQPAPQLGPAEIIVLRRTILQIAPCLGETGKRLLDAGEIYHLFQAMLTGELPIPTGLYYNVFTGEEPGNIIIQPGTTFVAIRQAVPEAITVTLPTPIAQGYSVAVKDSLGVAFANNFTINTVDGTLIDMLPTFIINNAFQAQTFVFDGFGWGVTA